MSNINKKWIDTHLMSKGGQLNNRVCCDSWWSLRGFDNILEEIKQAEGQSITEKLYNIYNQTTKGKCKICDSVCSFINFKSGYRKYCSTRCATQCPERNNKISTKNNYDSIHEKMKETNLKKYGTECFFSTEESITKIKNSKKERYGDENYNNLDKRRETCLTKYGVSEPVTLPSIILKIQETKSRKYPQLRDKNWLEEQSKTKNIPQIAEEMNTTPRTVWLWFQKFEIEPNNFSRNTSKGQKEIFDFIYEIHPDAVYNTRSVISPKELDIFVPSKQVAIEYNGMYWHGHDRKRHTQKRILCEEKNIRLLQFWDVEWLMNPDLIKSMISSALGDSKKLYARKCVSREISTTELKDFLDHNHLQGNVPCSIRYGLFHDNELVMCIGVGRCRYSKKYSHELLRFCTKKGITIVGGFSKLMSLLMFKNNKISSKQTFCDLRLFDGKSYEKFGFEETHITPPSYVYYRRGIIKNRLEFQKHKLKNLLQNFDPLLSEEENCFKNGWIKVYDCGMKSFSLSREKNRITNNC